MKIIKKAETSSKKYKIISLRVCLQNFKDFKKFWADIKKCDSYRDFILWFILCVTGAIDLHSAWGRPSDGFYSWVQKV